ncbi:MAG: DUF2877 domain-containing protein [Methylobacteriaceae bacterium]|jgi:hypothetical protein|nr:DUF2877 domain-containing protein [Methylobacteriaceae bacterium]
MAANSAIIGVQASGPWRGRVHSRFADAVNIAVGGGLITLLFNPHQASETNIVLADRRPMSGISDTSAVAFDGGALTVDGGAALPLAPFTVWRMPELGGAPIAPDRCEPLERYISAHPGKTDARFLEALERQDFSGIIGLGDGLTPSGDDMLVGFLLAASGVRPDCLPRLRKQYEPLTVRTTDISAHLLRQALKGKFMNPLVALLQALRSGDGVARALSVAAAVGSSSGRDGIFGLTHGLRYLGRRSFGGRGGPGGHDGHGGHGGLGGR